MLAGALHGISGVCKCALHAGRPYREAELQPGPERDLCNGVVTATVTRLLRGGSLAHSAVSLQQALPLEIGGRFGVDRPAVEKRLAGRNAACTRDKGGSCAPRCRRRQTSACCLSQAHSFQPASARNQAGMAADGSVSERSAEHAPLVVLTIVTPNTPITQETAAAGIVYKTAICARSLIQKQCARPTQLPTFLLCANEDKSLAASHRGRKEPAAVSTARRHSSGELACCGRVENPLNLALRQFHIGRGAVSLSLRLS